MKKKKVIIADEKPRPRQFNFQTHTHIRGYHACRPVDVAKYYREGVVPFDEDTMLQTAKEVFSVSLDEVSNVRRLPYRSTVYFCLFKEELLQDSGHYLCYGSEYLAGVAAHLDSNIVGAYHNILLRTGIPTILICDVPIEFIPESQIEDLYSNYSPGDSDWCFCLHQPLPPDCIVGHEHPRRIFDPLVRYTRVNEHVTCPLCAPDKTY